MQIDSNLNWIKITVSKLEIEIDFDNNIYYLLSMCSDNTFEDLYEIFICLKEIVSLNIDLRTKQAISNIAQQLFEALSDDDYDFFDWGKTNTMKWIKDLRNIAVKYRNIGHNWQFDKKQEKLLSVYYQSNQFLVLCLNTECYVSHDVRQEIEETLLLPIAEIEKRKKQ